MNLSSDGSWFPLGCLMSHIVLLHPRPPGFGPHCSALLQVTKVKLAQKQKEGIAEARSGRRQPVSAFSEHHFLQCRLCMKLLMRAEKYSQGSICNGNQRLLPCKQWRLRWPL